MACAPLIGLLTDFGTRDSYVAQMKGVILSSCDATVVDLTHDNPPFDVFAAGIFLREAAPRFESIIRRPVILVAVVDPGVGSSRRILAAESEGRLLLAPDNGILSVAASDSASFVDVVNESLFLPDGSTTFHGRDRFAPVAAALARGIMLRTLGPTVERASIVDLGYRKPDYAAGTPTGEVIRVDRFGNVVTDLEPDKLGAFESLLIGQIRVTERASSYAEKAGSKDPFVIVGSMGTLEVSVSGGSAAAALGVQVRDRVRVSR
jgi:S-adenosylmethionine hydrolase